MLKFIKEFFINFFYFSKIRNNNLYFTPNYIKKWIVGNISTTSTTAKKTVKFTKSKSTGILTVYSKYSNEIVNEHLNSNDSINILRKKMHGIHVDSLGTFSKI